MVRLQRLIAAAAALAGRERPAEADLWPVIFPLPSEQAQHMGCDLLRYFLSGAENGVLLSAPAGSSLGAKARAGHRSLPSRS